MVEYLLLLLKGAAIGVANIIPGVSGGTMALIMGIYERLIEAIHRVGPRSVRELAAALTFQPEGIARARREYQRLDATFIILLMVGAAIAILATAKLMDYLLNHHHAPTYAFFCGVILISIAFPWRMRKGRLRMTAIVALSVGTITALLLSMSMIGPQEAEKARQKLALKQGLQLTDVANDTEDRPLDAFLPELPPTISSYDHSPRRLLYLVLAGAVAISAMILPGVSGSFIALMMGVYFDILSAIGSRDIITLGAFGIGCCVGILAFSRLLNYVLHRWHDATMLFLIGLMLGSLYGLWPFRDFEIVGDEIVYTSLRLPVADANLAIAIAAFVIGVLLIVPFLRFEAKKTEHPGREV